MSNVALPPENINGHTKKLNYILDVLRSLSAVNPTLTVVDFGCGNGSAVSQYIIASLPPGAQYIGVDIHQASVDFANKHFSTPRASFQTTFPSGGPIDAIVYADVLEHLDDPLLILRSHREVSSPNCLMVGAIPNGVGPFELESWLDRKLQLSKRIAGLMRAIRRTPSTSVVPYNSDSGHLQFYRRGQFERILNESGFTLTDFRNGAFFGAMVTERFLRIFGQPFFKLNVQVADHLPFWAVSTWLFSAKRSDGS